MPNWCENDLFIVGKKAEIETLLWDYCKSNSGGIRCLDFDKVIPYPQEFKDLDDAAEKWKEEHDGKWIGAPKDGFNSGGCEWCIGNWGTKWNADPVSAEWKSNRTFKMSFCTAWSPPTSVILAISKKYSTLKLTLYYYERGMGYRGKLICKNGEIVTDDCWDYSGGRGG